MLFPWEPQACDWSRYFCLLSRMLGLWLLSSVAQVVDCSHQLLQLIVCLLLMWPHICLCPWLDWNKLLSTVCKCLFSCICAFTRDVDRNFDSLRTWVQIFYKNLHINTEFKPFNAAFVSHWSSSHIRNYIFFFVQLTTGMLDPSRVLHTIVGW